MNLTRGNEDDNSGVQSDGAAKLLSLFDAPRESENISMNNDEEMLPQSSPFYSSIEGGSQKYDLETTKVMEKPSFSILREKTIRVTNRSTLAFDTPAQTENMGEATEPNENESTSFKQGYSNHHLNLFQNVQKYSFKYNSFSDTMKNLPLSNEIFNDYQSYHTPLNDHVTHRSNDYMNLSSKPEDNSKRKRPPHSYLSEILCTVRGSCIFLLYHLVNALALSSAVSSTYSSALSTSSLLSPIAKMATLGSIFAGPILIHSLRNEVPSLYPSLDLFLVPFLTQLARIVNDTISYSNLDPTQYDNLFLNTFAILSGMGLILSGILSMLGSKIKLANIGSFLPHAVLCGFFSTVGITFWTSAFSIDTGGLSLQEVNMCRIAGVLVHHLPSLCSGSIMFWAGSKYMIPLVMFSSFVVYFVMAITGTSLEQAQSLGWFWNEKDFEYNYTYGSQVIGFDKWSPPFPLGVLHSLLTLNFDVQAVKNGSPTVFAMAFIYAIRCSLHTAALKKSRANILSVIKATRKMSSNNIVNEEKMDNDDLYGQNAEKYEKNQLNVLKVLMCYGNTSIISGLIGGFPCIPNIGAAATMTKLGPGSEKTPPQYGSIMLLVFFYLTNFNPVQYIPKITFSSLLILCCLDLMNMWFIKSYKMTKEKFEWLVVPLIMIFSFVVGMLSAVALGVAISTFLFVAAFYRTGVVKFIDTGLLVRSTVERSAQDSAWLDQNGDMIQIMVLQNYLFFGNSSSCLNYISSMFEDVTIPEGADFELPPKPKYLVIDFSICSGMDTSAIGIFGEVISLCERNQCKVHFAGVSQNLKLKMISGGIVGSHGQKQLYFKSDLETALGDAEDGLLNYSLHYREMKTHTTAGTGPSSTNGFIYALMQIDDQHGTEFQFSLRELQKYTVSISLKSDTKLFENQYNDGIIPESERGIFFIEHGLIKVERDDSFTVSRSLNSFNRTSKDNFLASDWSANASSIGTSKARSLTIGKRASFLKNHMSNRARKSHTFRLARIGPGWVIGGIESCAGLRNPGIYTAVTDCTLHHLPLSVVEEIENENPGLVLNLFKMLSHLMARRQDITIEQLSTLHSIISNPPVRKPISRLTLGAFHRAHIIASKT